LTAWCIFPQTTKYFGASKASFMVNYRVDNLDALLEDLKKSGIEIDPHREDYDYGRFAWITDPATALSYGNRQSQRKTDRSAAAAAKFRAR
jgi:hypothetical protein